MEDFDEEIVNPPTIYYVQNTYQEIKEIIWKKNYKEIEQDYIHVKQQLDGAVNFSKETFGKNRKRKIILCTAITPT
jgi:predicted house-cleaning noncanonical NTP pyrophosphatase (MazG superfamily)